MSPWCWYWKEADDEAYGEECPSREAVITSALRELEPGEVFEIVEARMSEAAEHEGSDFIPFLRSRNGETLIVGPDGEALPHSASSAAPEEPS